MPSRVRARVLCAFRRATPNRLVRKLWLWNDEEGRVATRIPYSDQRIYTLVDGAGAICAALAANVAMREFQSSAFGFTPAERDGAVEVLTFFSTATPTCAARRGCSAAFVEDTHGPAATPPSRPPPSVPSASTAASAGKLVAEREIESERRYFLRFDLRRPPG